jgi:hypothetical protein
MMVNLIRFDPDFLPERIRISSNYGELIKVLDPNVPRKPTA